MTPSNDNQLGQPIYLPGTSGIAVLLLHGWTSPPDEFRGLAEHLNFFGYAVSAPMFKGHGTRPEDLLGVTRHEWIEESKTALAKLRKDCDQIFVGGISMGGDIALLLSEEDKVAGVFALGAPIRFPFHTVVKISLWLMGLTKTFREKYFPYWIKKGRGERIAYSYYPVKSAQEAFRLAEEAERHLSRITKPLLAMQSTADHMVSNRSLRIIEEKAASKDREIVWLKDAYHVFVNDREVWEKIDNFIKKIQITKAK